MLEKSSLSIPAAPYSLWVLDQRSHCTVMLIQQHNLLQRLELRGTVSVAEQK